MYYEMNFFMAFEGKKVYAIVVRLVTSITVRCLIFRTGLGKHRNDITTLASYDRHGSDSILSLQCNS